MYTETGGSMAESIDLTGMNIPNHIAIIMDGNGRWAKKRFLPRNAGHVAGAKTVEKIIQVLHLSLHLIMEQEMKL